MRRIILLLMIMLVMPQAVKAATIHGGAYDGSFNLITNVQFNINTTPAQSHVSKNGLYFFFALPGTYEISAEKKYGNNTLYYTKKVVDITKDGEYNIDVVLEKVSDIDLEEDDPNKDMGTYWLILGAIGLIIAAVALLLMFQRRKNVKNVPPVIKEKEVVDAPKDVIEPEKVPAQKAEPEKNEEDAANLEKILSIIKKEGGRATQKEIRKQMPLSEAKVSLIIAQLEHEGKVTKIKKGRGNIICLK